MADRQEVLGVLKRVEPALSGKDLIQVFACLCFDGEHVHAFDDVVALIYPFDLGIKGAIRGRVLIDFLASSKAKEVEFTPSGETVLLKAGRSKLESPVLPESEFLFKRPKMKTATVFLIGADFLDAFGKAMISMGRDPSHPSRLGVTVATVSDPKPGFLFYSSDNKAASRVFFPVKGNEVSDVAAILPPRFCELLTEIGKTDSPKQLTLTEEWVEALFESGLRLFSRAVSGADVKTFEGVINRMLKSKPPFLPVPKGLDKALERAMVVAKYAKEPFTRVDTKEGKMVLVTTSDGAGKARDVITLEEGAPTVENVWVAPELVYRVLPMSEKVAFAPGCVLFTGKNFTHLVTTVESAGE